MTAFSSQAALEKQRWVNHRPGRVLQTGWLKSPMIIFNDPLDSKMPWLTGRNRVTRVSAPRKHLFRLCDRTLPPTRPRPPSVFRTGEHSSRSNPKSNLVRAPACHLTDGKTQESVRPEQITGFPAALSKVVSSDRNKA